MIPSFIVSNKQTGIGSNPREMTNNRIFNHLTSHNYFVHLLFRYFFFIQNVLQYFSSKHMSYWFDVLDLMSNKQQQLLDEFELNSNTIKFLQLASFHINLKCHFKRNCSSTIQIQCTELGYREVRHGSNEFSMKIIET